MRWNTVFVTGEPLSIELGKQFFHLFPSSVSLVTMYCVAHSMNSVFLHRFNCIEDIEKNQFNGHLSIGKPLQYNKCFLVVDGKTNLKGDQYSGCLAYISKGTKLSRGLGDNQNVIQMQRIIKTRDYLYCERGMCYCLLSWKTIIETATHFVSLAKVENRISELCGAKCVSLKVEMQTYDAITLTTWCDVSGSSLPELRGKVEKSFPSFININILSSVLPLQLGVCAIADMCL